MKLKTGLSVTTRHGLKGLYFLIPFYLGFIFFYIKPITQSIIFAFNNVSVSTSGYKTSFCDLENFTYALRSDDAYITTLFTDFLNLLWKAPVIIILSLFLALLINQKFKGRLFVRAVFFLPVIISTGYVLNLLQSDLVVNNAISSSAMIDSGTVSQTTGLNELLIQAGIDQKIVEFITNVNDQFFALIWKSGIQMLIFLSGLQSIPSTLYEAASVEGASAWESFCKITIPMLSPIIIVNIIYTIVDSYSSADNGVFKLITTNISLNRFGIASAMAWLYFILVAIIFAVIFLISKKKS